jgi:branched-chain amino acid transport system substrate-binding protein
MGPLVGEFASNGIPQWEGIQVALDDFNTVNWLPAPDGTSRRNVAVIGCHDIDDPLTVGRHLVNDVGVNVVLGPAFSGITLDVATDVTIPADTLMMSSSATSPAITNLPDNGLVWRTCPSDAVQAIPLAYLVSQMEENIRTAQSLMPSDQIRVAMAVKGDAYGKGLADAVSAILKFNGKSPSDNGNNFLRVDYVDPAEDPNFDFGDTVSSLIQKTPHIVLPLGTNEGITKIMLAIEAGWQAGPARPIYVFPDGGRLDELETATKQNAELRNRVLGTVPGFTGTGAYQAFANRFNGYWGHVPGTYADTAYDSAYLFAYAVAAAASNPLTGPNLAEGLKKTVGGDPISAGSNSLNTAFGILFSGSPIDYQGASGPLEFDLNTGEAPADIDIWCIDSTSGSFVSSGQRYDAASDSIVGSRSACPASTQ